MTISPAACSAEKRQKWKDEWFCYTRIFLRTCRNMHSLGSSMEHIALMSSLSSYCMSSLTNSLLWIYFSFMRPSSPIVIQALKLFSLLPSFWDLPKYHIFPTYQGLCQVYLQHGRGGLLGMMKCTLDMSHFQPENFFFIRVSLLCRLSVVNPWGHSPTTSFYFPSFPMQNLDPSIRTLFNWVSNYLFSSVTLNFRSWICSPAISILSLHKIRNSSFVGYSEWLLALTHKFKLIFNCLVFPYPTMQYHSNHLHCFSEVNFIVLLCVPHYFSNSRILSNYGTYLQQNIFQSHHWWKFCQ